MEKIIKKYEDVNGYVTDIFGLYNELCILFTKKEAYEIIKNVYVKNDKIKEDLKRKNNKQETIKKLREKEVILVDYVNKVQNTKEFDSSKKTYVREFIEISSYISYILDNVDDKSYLSILPNDTSKESLLLLDNIITYFIKEINITKYLLNFANSSEIEKLDLYTAIYNNLIEYKKNLINPIKTSEITENEVVYYMNGNVSFLYSDIVDSPLKYTSIKVLIDSIKSGQFKGLKYFSNNDKTKKLFEVRDLSNKTRVFFRIVGYKKYCIIGALVNKSETNSAYKNFLDTRYDRYKSEIEKTSGDDKKLTKLLRGDNCE